jgi:hypothetical protein
MVPAAAFFLVFGVRIAWIDYQWLEAKTALQYAQTEAAVQIYANVQGSVPPSSSMNLWFSRALLATAQRTGDQRQIEAVWPAVLNAGIRSVHTSEDRQNAVYNLAVLYAYRGQTVEAEQTAREAIRIAPAWYKPRWLLAEILSGQGKVQEAAAQAHDALDLSGQKQPDTVKALTLLERAGR